MSTYKAFKKDYLKSGRAEDVVFGDGAISQDMLRETHFFDLDW